jgi:4-hydroxy-3-methylbut-2-enyl diphosphate reductase
LYDICRETNERSHNIEEATELRREWFDGAESVGICGATSTPKWLMEKIANEIIIIEK